MKYIVVFITAASKKEAGRITKSLLDAKLVACVNAVPGVASSYWWKGRIEKAKEYLLIIKTERALFKELVKRVKKEHSYTVPEIIAVPIEAGNADYLKWIHNSLERRKG
ncbi:MAG: divalent-cation tolerance protein CutA [Candidatus Firestonebacteria bacterium]